MEEIFNHYNELVKVYAIIVTATMVLPIIVALLYRTYWNKPLRRFFRFQVASFSVSLFMQLFIWTVGHYRPYFVPYMDKWNIHDTMFIGIFAYLSNFALLGAFYIVVFKSAKISIAVKWLSIILFCAALINYLFIEGIRVYSLFNATASALYCFIIPLLHFWFVFKTDTQVVIKHNSYFWLGLGLIIPNLIGLFLHFTGNKLNETDVVLYFKLSIAKYYFVMLSQIFIAIGFYYARYTKYLPEKW
jgi:hypothetical protein